jgi:hypothetical protein
MINSQLFVKVDMLNERLMDPFILNLLMFISPNHFNLFLIILKLHEYCFVRRFLIFYQLEFLVILHLQINLFRLNLIFVNNLKLFYVSSKNNYLQLILEFKKMMIKVSLHFNN